MTKQSTSSFSCMIDQLCSLWYAPVSISDDDVFTAGILESSLSPSFLVLVPTWVESNSGSNVTRRFIVVVVATFQYPMWLVCEDVDDLTIAPHLILFVQASSSPMCQRVFDLQLEDYPYSSFTAHLFHNFFIIRSNIEPYHFHWNRTAFIRKF